jgi:hypothetical protein
VLLATPVLNGKRVSVTCSGTLLMNDRRERTGRLEKVVLSSRDNVETTDRGGGSEEHYKKLSATQDCACRRAYRHCQRVDI